MQSLTQEALSEILEQFSLAGSVTSVRPYGNGHINDTFLAVTDAKPEGYILQRVTSAVFPHPAEVMENVHCITGFLRQKLTACGHDATRETLTLLPLRDGSGVFVTDEDGSCWRVYLNITDTVSYDLPESEDIFCQSGHAFGAFQMQLADFPAAELYETIPHFHDTPRRVEALRTAVKENRADRVSEIGAEIGFALDRAAKAATLVNMIDTGELPLRVTHNDTKLNNVLIDKATGRGLCVIDLDTVMPGLCAYDFGDAIRFGANTALEDEQDLTKVHFSLPMFRAFSEGFLAEAGRALTPAEIRTLPLGAWMMTFECGIRFLTDYLNGDVYFKVAYPEHNLVRARNQFALLRDMEAHASDMDAIMVELGGTKA